MGQHSFAFSQPTKEYATGPHATPYVTENFQIETKLIFLDYDKHHLLTYLLT